MKKSRLLDLFKYDYDTGDFISVARMGSREVGQIAGHPTCKGTVISIDNKQYLAHILAHVWITGRLPTKHIKHKDGNKNNNAKNNLVYKDGSAFEVESRIIRNPEPTPTVAMYKPVVEEPFLDWDERPEDWDSKVYKSKEGDHWIPNWKECGFVERPLDNETYKQAKKRLKIDYTVWE